MRHAGFSLIELMVTVAIVGLLMALGIQSFNTMMASTRTRATADSILSGLKLARAEAIKRNVPIRFEFFTNGDATPTLNNTCESSVASGLWVVTQSDVVGSLRGLAWHKCASLPYTPPDRPDICNPDVPPCSDTVTTNCRGATTATNPNPATCSDDPLVAFKSEGAMPANVQVAASATAVTFNPLGRVTSNTEGTAPLSQVNITSTVADAKAWRIVVLGSSGGIKLCDPAAVAPAALACP